VESEENAAAFPSDPTGPAAGNDLSYTTWADATCDESGAFTRCPKWMVMDTSNDSRDGKQ
jgi:hypothetical protein